MYTSVNNSVGKTLLNVRTGEGFLLSILKAWSVCTEVCLRFTSRPQGLEQGPQIGPKFELL